MVGGSVGGDFRYEWEKIITNDDVYICLIAEQRKKEMNMPLSLMAGC